MYIKTLFDELLQLRRQFLSYSAVERELQPMLQALPKPLTSQHPRQEKGGQLLHSISLDLINEPNCLVLRLFTGKQLLFSVFRKLFRLFHVHALRRQK